MSTRSGLLDRHIAFLEALRAAGLPVSISEDLDAVAVLQALDWADRASLKEGYAATLVKRHQWRPTFDALFDLYFPRMIGEGAGGRLDPAAEGQDGEAGDGAEGSDGEEEQETPPAALRPGPRTGHRARSGPGP